MSARFIRKWSKDVVTNGYSPIPTQVISNEEYLPPPPTVEQQRVATLLHATARTTARRLGVSRREFLGSSAGMATAFLALNTVFGRFFEVDPVEAVESAADDERPTPDQFVFDIQTPPSPLPASSPTCSAFDAPGASGTARSTRTGARWRISTSRITQYGWVLEG